MQTQHVIRINGVDVSSNFASVLMSIEITDKAGMTSDTCGIELDDADGQIEWPEEGADIEIDLGDERGVATVFKGKVSEVRSAGARSGGRRIMITGHGMDAKGKPKQPREKHWDGATVGKILKDAAALAGITKVIVSPALAGISLDYWAMQTESLIHNGQRLANEIGGTFKIAGNVAILADRNGGTSASGQPLPTIKAKWGDNLISWELSPNLNRNRYKTVRARYYDPKSATWKEETVEVGDTGAEATHTRRHKSRDKKQAKVHVAGHVKGAKRARGGGSISILPTLEAQPEGLVILEGARPGVDGPYRIDAVFYRFDRGSGWTQRLDVKDPQDGTGKDSRAPAKPKKAAAASGTVQEAGAGSAGSNVG